MTSHQVSNSCSVRTTTRINAPQQVAISPPALETLTPTPFSVFIFSVHSVFPYRIWASVYRQRYVYRTSPDHKILLKAWLQTVFQGPSVSKASSFQHRVGDSDTLTGCGWSGSQSSRVHLAYCCMNHKQMNLSSAVHERMEKSSSQHGKEKKKRKLMRYMDIHSVFSSVLWGEIVYLKIEMGDFMNKLFHVGL